KKGGSREPPFSLSITRCLLVNELCAGEIDERQHILLRPVILRMLPFRLVTALGQEMHAAHHVTRIEVLRVEPRLDLHIVIFRAKRDSDFLSARLLHMPQKAGNEVTENVHTQRPACAEISEHP